MGPISLQITSFSPERDRWHISITYGLLLALSILLFVALPPANSQEAAETKPKQQRKNYDPDAVKHYNRGLELQQAGFLNKALEEYKAAIKADDRLEQAYSNLGLIYISQSNFVKAQEAFDKALAIKPNRPTSLNGLASVLYHNHQVQPAIETWKKAIRFNPHFAPAYSNMGTALADEKNYPEALDAYVKAVTISPDMADAYYRMGTLLNKLKHPAQAKALLDHAVLLSPESEFARDARKQINALSEKFAKEAQATATEVPMVIHGASPSRENDGSGELSHRTASNDSNKGLAAKGASDSDASPTATKDESAPPQATPDTKQASSGDSSASTATGDGAVKDKPAKKKRKPMFKHQKPLNDEEKLDANKSNAPEEMKMFIKQPEQESDLQAKPQ